MPIGFGGAGDVNMMLPLLHQLMGQQQGPSVDSSVFNYMQGYGRGFYGFSQPQNTALSGIDQGWGPMLMMLGQSAGILPAGHALVPTDRPFHESITSHLSNMTLRQGLGALRQQVTERNVFELMDKFAQQRGVLPSPMARLQVQEMLRSPAGQLGLQMLSMNFPDIFEQSFGRSGSGLGAYQAGWDISSRMFDTGKGRFWTPQQRQMYGQTLYHHYYGTPEKRRNAPFSSNDFGMYRGYLSSQGLLGSLDTPSVDMSPYQWVPGAEMTEEQEQNAEEILDYLRYTTASTDTFRRSDSLRRTVRAIDEVNEAREEFLELQAKYVPLGNLEAGRHERMLELSRAYTKMRNAEVAAVNVDDEHGLVLDADDRIAFRAVVQERKNIDVGAQGALFDIFNALNKEESFTGFFSELLGWDKASDLAQDIFDWNIHKPGEGSKLYQLSEAAKASGEKKDLDTYLNAKRHLDTRLRSQGFGWIVDQLFDKETGFVNKDDDIRILGTIFELQQAQEDVARAGRRREAWGSGIITLENLEDWAGMLSTAPKIEGMMREVREATEKGVSKEAVKKILKDTLGIDATDALVEHTISAADNPQNLMQSLIREIIPEVKSALGIEAETPEAVEMVLGTLGGVDQARALIGEKIRGEEADARKREREALVKAAEFAGVPANIDVSTLGDIDLKGMTAVQELMNSIVSDPNVERFIAGARQIAQSEEQWQKYAHALGSLKGLMTDRNASPAQVLSTFLAFAGGNLNQADIDRVNTEIASTYASARVLGYSDRSIRERLADSATLAAATSANRNFVGWHAAESMVYEAAFRSGPSMAGALGSAGPDENTAIMSNALMGHITGVQGNLQGAALRMIADLEAKGVTEGTPLHEYMEALRQGRERFTALGSERSTSITEHDLRVLWEASIPSDVPRSQFAISDAYVAHRSENQRALYANAEMISTGLSTTRRAAVQNLFAQRMFNQRAGVNLTDAQTEEYKKVMQSVFAGAMNMESLWEQDETLRNDVRGTLEYIVTTGLSRITDEDDRAKVREAVGSAEAMYYHLQMSTMQTSGLGFVPFVQIHGEDASYKREMELIKRDSIVRQNQVVTSWNQGGVVARWRDAMGDASKDASDLDVMKYAAGFLDLAPGSDLRIAFDAFDEKNSELTLAQEELKNIERQIAEKKRDGGTESEIAALQRDAEKIRTETIRGRQAAVSDAGAGVRKALNTHERYLSDPERAAQVRALGTIERDLEIDWTSLTVLRQGEVAEDYQVSAMVQLQQGVKDSEERRYIRKLGHDSFEYLDKDGKWQAIAADNILMDTLTFRPQGEFGFTEISGDLHFTDENHRLRSLGVSAFKTAKETEGMSWREKIEWILDPDNPNSDPSVLAKEHLQQLLDYDLRREGGRMRFKGADGQWQDFGMDASAYDIIQKHTAGDEERLLGVLRHYAGTPEAKEFIEQQMGLLKDGVYTPKQDTVDLSKFTDSDTPVATATTAVTEAAATAQVFTEGLKEVAAEYGPFKEELRGATEEVARFREQLTGLHLPALSPETESLDRLRMEPPHMTDIAGTPVTPSAASSAAYEADTVTLTAKSINLHIDRASFMNGDVMLRTDQNYPSMTGIPRSLPEGMGHA